MSMLEMINNINTNLAGGWSREKIFKEYVSKSPTKAAKIAYCLASIPHEELRKKYLRTNAILFLLLPILATLSLVSELPINMQESTLFIVIKILVPLVFAYFVYQFHGGIYRLLGLWCLLDLAETVVLMNFTTATGISKIVVLMATVFLSFFLARRVFFNLKVLGPRRDTEGRYML